MLIRSLNDGHTLMVGGQTFQAVAPGIFEVPEAIGRVLVAFPHFEEAHGLPADMQDDADDAQDMQAETTDEEKATPSVKRRGGKKG